MKLVNINYQIIYNEVKKYILNQTSPFLYYSLFSYISKKLNLDFPDSKYFKNLFQKNFIIKNILYNLQFEFYKEFKFALIFEHDLIFFSKIIDNPSFFSIIHGKFIEDTELDRKNIVKKGINNLPISNPLRDYYFDFENLKDIDEYSIEKAIDSGFKLADNPFLFDEALKIFSLSSSSLSINSLNQAYRKLIKKYHPDLSSDFKEKDKEIIFKIYDAYKLLKSILI